MKLQNNFTTAEQSKRLLELGVPEWTADFFYPTKKSDMPIIIVDIKVGWNLKYAIPCWSVGRLIEILNICSMYMFFTLEGEEILGATNIEQAIKKLQQHVRDKTIDFSKLEE